MGSPNYNCSYSQNFMMHEFYNCPSEVIIPMFLVNFWHHKKFKEWPHCFMFQHGTSLLQQMQNYGKLEKENSLLFCIPISKLGNNSLLATRNKQCMVFGMLMIFGIIPLPFFTLISKLFKTFCQLACLQRESHLATRILPFLSTSLQILHLIVCKLPFDLKQDFAHGSFTTQHSLSFLFVSQLFFY